MKEIVEYTGIIGGLLYTGLSLRIDARVRRAQTIIEITKQHRDIWSQFLDKPQLKQIFNRNRDMATHPLADEEVHFVNFLFHHLRATFYARSAGIFIQPEGLKQDIREFFSYPAVASVWNSVQQASDDAFASFVKRNVSSK